MSCPKREDIQAWLEGGFAAAAAARLEGHLASCPACRKAAESRRLILLAAESLEPIPVPAGFAAEVMARLEPAPDSSLPRMTLGGWLAALAAGAFVFATTLGALALLSGRGVGLTFARLGQGLMESVQAAATAAGKLIVLASLFFKIAGRFSASLVKTLARALSLAGPGFWAALLAATLVCLVCGAALWRRRMPVLEERDES